MKRKAESGFGANNPIPPEQTVGQTYNTQYDPNQTITMENNPINNSFGTAIGSVISAGQVPQDRGYDYSLPYRQGENPPDYTFQNAMPTEQNGYHLGSYPQTEMYGDPKDWQRQMVRNELYHGQKAEGTGDNTMNIKDHSNVNSFGQVFQNAENPTTQTTKTSGIVVGQVPESQTKVPGAEAYLQNGTTNNPGQANFLARRAQTLQNQRDAIAANPNFQEPSSDNQTAQPTGGVSIGADGFNNPNIIGREQVQQQNPYNANYTIQQWLEDDRARGVTNPVISLLRYQTFIDPIVQQAKQDDLRNAFAVYKSPDATPEEKTNALAKLEYYLNKPGLEEDMAWQRESRDWERKRRQAIEENGFVGSLGRGGRVRGTGNPVGRPRSGRNTSGTGFSLDDFATEALNRFKYNPTSKDSFNGLVDSMSDLYDNYLADGYSPDEAAALVKRVMGKKLGRTYYSLPSEQLNTLHSGIFGTNPRQRTNVGSGEHGGGNGSIDDNNSSGSMIGRFKEIFNWENNAPSGYNENGMYIPEKLHDEYEEGRKKREELRKQGRLNEYTGRDMNEEREETLGLLDKILGRDKQEQEEEESRQLLD